MRVPSATHLVAFYKKMLECKNISKVPPIKIESLWNSTNRRKLHKTVIFVDTKFGRKNCQNKTLFGLWKHVKHRVNKFSSKVNRK